MRVLKQIKQYLYLTNNGTLEKPDQVIRLMHQINRIALLMFLFGIMIIASKWVVKMVLSL
ncbi:MAG: hypothetical protein RLY16_950 [Bacteroidota bacterium]|jgi:hypothetical protein